MLLDEMTIHLRYSQYNAILIKLGNLKILEIPTIDDLTIADIKSGRSLISRAYKEVKGLSIDNKKLPAKTRKLDITQYFCYISTGYLINSLKEFVLPLKEIAAPSLTEWAWVIIDNYRNSEIKNNKINTRNLLRLFDTYSPFYFILKSLTGSDEINSERPTKDELFDQIRCTSLLSAFIELLIDEDIFGPDHATHTEAMGLLKSLGDARI